MNLPVMLVRVIGAILAVLGLALVLTALGITTPVHLPWGIVADLIVGVLLIGLGARIIKGGVITL